MDSVAALILLAGACACGAAATWLVRRVALSAGIVNHPNPIIPQHVKPVAYMGGLGVLIGSVAAMACWVGFAAELLGQPANDMAYFRCIALPSLLFCVLGLMDDLKEYSASFKFLMQIIVAGIAVACGIGREFTGLAWIDWPLSGLWILIMVNALNLTDVCDGLVGGLAAIALGAAALLAVGVWPASLSLAVAGACAGFLVFNSPSASIYLGDAGSHLLGFLLAAATLLARPAVDVWPWIVVMGLLGGVFLFELLFLVVVRARKGLPWWKGSPDHFSLRLQHAGLSKWQTDLVAWSVQIILVAGALLVVRRPGLSPAVLIGAILLAAACWAMLVRWNVPPKQPGDAPGEA